MAAVRKTPPTGHFDTFDGSGRFAIDKLLRDNGFVIAYRPRKGEDLWRSPQGDILPLSRALRKLSKVDVEDAKYAQALYLESKYK